MTNICISSLTDGHPVQSREYRGQWVTYPLRQIKPAILQCKTSSFDGRTSPKVGLGTRHTGCRGPEDIPTGNVRRSLSSVQVLILVARSRRYR